MKMAMMKMATTKKAMTKKAMTKKATMKVARTDRKIFSKTGKSIVKTSTGTTHQMQTANWTIRPYNLTRIGPMTIPTSPRWQL